MDERARAAEEPRLRGVSEFSGYRRFYRCVDDVRVHPTASRPLRRRIMPSLKIELVDVYEEPLTQACNVRLRHRTSGVLRVVNSAQKIGDRHGPADRRLPGAGRSAAFRAVGSFTNVGSGKPSALHLVFRSILPRWLPSRSPASTSNRGAADSANATSYSVTRLLVAPALRTARE